ncbi:unnamed protein product [Didymodactylos carnosus]|uniref:Uncharacterized protein n=1 Tax=Didymodactylos carnosus TaxID=1234261 RepID=A0A8S2XK24_9BILA|nr:unnamed protein product [Didymodactylos carnosus]
MNSIEAEIEVKYEQQKRRERYGKRNDSRRRKRLEKQILDYPDVSSPTQHTKKIFERTTTLNGEDDHSTFVCDADEYDTDDNNHLIEYRFNEQEETNGIETNSMSFHIFDDVEPTEHIQSNNHYSSASLVLPLHDYTNNLTFDYCENFMFLARQANLSKKHTNDLLYFISTGLPVPNNMPSTEKQLLSIPDVQELFTKRCVCLLCYRDFDYEQNICPQCGSLNKNSIAYIYDSNVELIIKTIMTRLDLNVNEYKNKININEDADKTKDIPFGDLYQKLLKENNYQNMISMLLHVDGISITRSTKLKMWMFSGSIVELPPKLRSQRSNMVLISIWVGYVEPRSNLWLNMSIKNLEVIKVRGNLYFIILD